MSPENKNGRPEPPVFASKDNLDCPAACVERHQRNGDNNGANVQLAPFTGNQTTDHQRREADHNAGHDVTGQYDEDRGNQARHRVHKIRKVDFRHVAQHQQANVHQQALRPPGPRRRCSGSP